MRAENYLGKRELVALLSLSSWCLMIVVWLFPVAPWVCLQFVIVVFHEHIYYFSYNFTWIFLMMPSFKIAQMVPLHLTGGLTELQKRFFKMISPEQLVQIYDNSTELFLLIPYIKIAQMILPRWTKGPSELQIRNIFIRHLLLNHWSKFKIISQNCSS